MTLMTETLMPAHHLTLCDPSPINQRSMKGPSMKQCPDCKTALTAITVLDHQGGATPKQGLSYTVGEAPKKSLWSGGIKNLAGVVHAYLCESCTRVLFFATPK